MKMRRLTPSFAYAVFMLVAALLLSFAKPVNAGDFAEQHILGFSPDGRYFAFEQFGVQDGSGFAYADIFVIGTARDEWVKGSPFRVLLRDERARLKHARGQAMTKAGPLLRKLAISKPGRLLASNPPGELSADPHKVSVNARFAIPQVSEPWIFTLEEMPLASTRCAQYLSEPAKGFRLSARRQGGATQLLHEDSAIPNSRGCPLRYAISDILVHEPDASARIFVILVSVYSFGFEGPDRRFLAVTKRLP